MLVFATLGAPERRRALPRRHRSVDPEPEPTPVATGRVTVISVADPFAGEAEAAAWLRGAGEDDLARDLAVINRALQLFRLVTGDPHRHTVARSQLLVARLGFGAGEAVADGRWQQARELLAAHGRERRAKVLQPQARLAALLGRRERTLVCEELALRAQLDIEEGRHREAALQTLVALDAAIAELSVDAFGTRLATRIEELRSFRESVGEAAQTALTAEPDDPQQDAVARALERIEAALRARAVEAAR